MAEVNPVTMEPKVPKSGDEKKYNDLVNTKAKSDRLSADLESERGQLVLNKIQEHLLNRINKLMDDDGECRALKKILIDMGMTLNMGELAVRNLMRLVGKRQAP